MLPRLLAPIRLSKLNCQLITAGLDYLAANYGLWSTKGRLPYAHPELRWLPKSFDRGHYSAEFMQQVLAVRQAARHGCHHGGRLYDLTAFQVAGLILAVRVVAQMCGTATSRPT
jgi:hypothetical protein